MKDTLCPLSWSLQGIKTFIYLKSKDNFLQQNEKVDGVQQIISNISPEPR